MGFHHQLFNHAISAGSIVILAWSILSVDSASAKPKSIVLDDGSTLVGNVISFDSNGCKIQTQHLGLITVPLEKVVEITPVEAQKRPAGTRSKVEAEMIALDLYRETHMRAQEAQREIIMGLLKSNPKMAATVERLQANPKLIEAISDPSILLAMEMGDIEALMANPHIRELLDPATLEALERIEQKRKTNTDD